MEAGSPPLRDSIDYKALELNLENSAFAVHPYQTGSTPVCRFLPLPLKRGNCRCEEKGFSPTNGVDMISYCM